MPIKKPVKRTIADINNDMLLCRMGLLGHRWAWASDDNIVVSTRNVPIEVTRTEVCERCDCERSYVYSLPSFTVMATRRRYPKEYQTKGSGRAYGPAVRQEHFKRTQGRLIGRKVRRAG